MRTNRKQDIVSEAWGQWVAGLGEWHAFGGLTYDPQRVVVGSHQSLRARPHPEAVVKHLRSWLQESNRRLDGRLEAAVVAVEAHKSGWPHAHPLIRLAGGLQYADLATVGQVWYERRGYAKLEAPKSIDAVSAYAAKYLSKDVQRGDVFLWPERGALTTVQLGAIADDESTGVIGKGYRQSLPGTGVHVPRLKQRDVDWRELGAVSERYRAWTRSPWNR